MVADDIKKRMGILYGPRGRQMRRMFREAYERDEDAFAEVLTELMSAGEHWRNLLPPIEKKNSRTARIGRQTLAQLLADYRNRPGNCSREAFLQKLAEEGCRYGSTYREAVWRTADAIESALKDAQSLYNSDADFMGEVEQYQDIFREAKISSAGWDEL